MKIVQLVYHLGSGGAEKFIVDLSNELSRLGEDVTILMIRDDSVPGYSFNCKFLLPEVKLVSLKLKEGFKFSYIRKVSAALDVLTPDVVHTHLGVLPFIFFYSFKKQTRFVHTIHSLSAFETSSWAIKCINKKLFRHNIQPVTISKACDESFVDYYGLHNSICIENGRDNIRPSSRFPQVEAELKNLQRPLFIHVARYAPEKNQTLLINAFNEIHKKGEAGSILILGDGFDEHADIVAKACEGIHFLGLKDNVGDYLLNSDYFCLSSRIEGMPISVIEAMNCGLPVISTPAGGVPDMINTGINGVISSDFSVGSYEEAFATALKTDFSKDAIIHRFERLYSISVCAQKYMHIYTMDITH